MLFCHQWGVITEERKGVAKKSSSCKKSSLHGSKIKKIKSKKYPYFFLSFSYVIFFKVATCVHTAGDGEEVRWWGRSGKVSDFLCHWWGKHHLFSSFVCVCVYQAEDLSDEAFARRHWALEQREKLRWSSWNERKSCRRPTRWKHINTQWKSFWCCVFGIFRQSETPPGQFVTGPRLETNRRSHQSSI